MTDPAIRRLSSCGRSMGRGVGGVNAAPGSNRSGWPSESMSKAVVQSRRSCPSATWFRSSRATANVAPAERPAPGSRPPETTTLPIRIAVYRTLADCPLTAGGVTRATASSPETVSWATSATVTEAPSTINASESSRAEVRSVVPSAFVSRSIVRRTIANWAEPAIVSGPAVRNVPPVPVPVRLPDRRVSKSSVIEIGALTGDGSERPGLIRSGVPLASRSNAVVQLRRSKSSSDWLRSSRSIENEAESPMS